MSNSIEFYNLNTKKLFKELKVPRQGPNAFGKVESFICRDFDVLLFSMAPPKIGIMDLSGQILMTIPHNVKISSLQKGQRPFIIDEDIYLGQLYPARESNGKLSSTGQKHSFLNVTINLISGINKSSLLTYPKELIGKDVFVMPIERVLGFKNCFVYHFGLINSLFLTYDHVKFLRYPLETNYRLSIMDNADL